MHDKKKNSNDLKSWNFSLNLMENYVKKLQEKNVTVQSAFRVEWNFI
jgi:hypothetical protein